MITSSYDFLSTFTSSFAQVFSSHRRKEYVVFSGKLALANKLKFVSVLLKGSKNILVNRVDSAILLMFCMNLCQCMNNGFPAKIRSLKTSAKQRTRNKIHVLLAPIFDKTPVTVTSHNDFMIAFWSENVLVQHHQENAFNQTRESGCYVLRLYPLDVLTIEYRGIKKVDIIPQKYFDTRCVSIFRVVMLLFLILTWGIRDMRGYLWYSLYVQRTWQLLL